MKDLPFNPAQNAFRAEAAHLPLGHGVDRGTPLGAFHLRI